MDLKEMKCSAYHEGMPLLAGEKLQEYLSYISGWNLIEDRKLTKDFKFSDFKTALAFVNCVGDLAEIEGHHPGVFLDHGNVRVEIWTHAANGLVENDFILAAKIDTL